MSWARRAWSGLWLAAAWLCCSGVLRGAPDPEQAAWQAAAARHAQDPAVVRYYPFSEGGGDLVANVAGDHAGSLLLVGYGPYGVYRGWPRWPAPRPEDCPRWSTGRWPWKAAVACGAAPVQLLRARVRGTPHGVFTVEAWLRAQELGEQEWGGGDVLAMGSAWGTGWRVVIERQHWCRAGIASFRMGVPDGVVATPMNAFTYGDWHHLAAVWDGQAITLYVDGEATTTPTAGPYTPPDATATEENDLGGLTIGGGVRCEIDELVLHDRALAPAEIVAAAALRPALSPSAHRAQWQQQQVRRVALARLELQLPQDSGGYFPVGQPIVATVRLAAAPLPPDCHTARLVVQARMVDAAADTQEVVLTPAAAAGELAQFSFTPTRCGLYTATLQVCDAGGQVLRAAVFPFAVTVPPVAAPEAPAFILGVAHDTVPQPAARAIGATWARVVVDWGRVEPERGIYNWELADRQVETAAASHLRLLLCVTGWPAWIPRAPGRESLPADLTHYRDFLQVLARRYRQQVGAWELWDAPAGPPAFRFRHAAGAADYLVLLQAAVPTLRQATPQARVLGAGVPGDSSYLATWPAQLAARGGRGLLDGVVYQFAPATDAPSGMAALARALAGEAEHPLTLWNTASGYRQAAGPLGDFVPADFAQYPTARRLTVAGAPAVQSWPYLLFTPRQSAILQVQQVLRERAAGAAALFLACGSNDYYPAWNASDGEPSEKGVALAALQALLATATSVTAIPTPAAPAVHLFQVLRPAQAPALVLFADQAGAVTAALGAGELTARDWLGNPVLLPPAIADGRRALALDPTPLVLFTATPPADLDLH